MKNTLKKLRNFFSNLKSKIKLKKENPTTSYTTNSKTLASIIVPVPVLKESKSKNKRQRKPKNPPTKKHPKKK